MGEPMTVQVGQVYEQVNPPPGYSPGRYTVTAIQDDRWARWRGSWQGIDHPVRITTVLDAGLYRCVDPAQHTKSESADG